MKAGHPVIAVTRAAEPSHRQPAVRWMTLDPQDVVGHHRLFAETDCVVDARNQRYDDWSAYPAMIEATLAALDGTAARYVYVGNVYSYGYPPSSDAIDETAPRNPVSQKGWIRHGIEAQLETAMSARPIGIVRFPDFYGISTDLLPHAIRWFGPASLHHQFVHLPDAARALRLIAEASAYGEVWHIAGAEPLTGYQLREIACQATGRRTRLLVMGPALVRLVGLAFAPARGLIETQYLWQKPVTLDMTKFARRFGTDFIHDHAQALQEILAGAR